MKQIMLDVRKSLDGVLPNPVGQVEQITYALIYKFMSDLDDKNIAQGKAPEFFTGSLKEYTWNNVISSDIGDKIRIYSNGLKLLQESEHLPAFLIDIFKGASVVHNYDKSFNYFVSSVDKISYDDSENLGYAYEFLLNFMASQGRGGQFRTPKHITDFIIKAVNPSDKDSVLDPACGTGGFLMGAFKHVLGSGGDIEKFKNKITGYDIDSIMVKFSLVNKYLNGFKKPNILNYNTLYRTEHWDDNYDVILSNPPFVAPLGGVVTHGKFNITTSRVELLFVDYIASHLNEFGRSGIIVPEGVPFNEKKVYKNTRDKLLDIGLYAVVSLPVGVFHPYSSVKTTIFLTDKSLASHKEIMFYKVNHDGYSATSKRKPIYKNDLPDALNAINRWKEGKKTEGATYVSKDRIKNFNSILIGDMYEAFKVSGSTKYPLYPLKDLVSVVKKVHFSKSRAIAGNVPVYNGNNTPEFYHNIANVHEDAVLIKALGTDTNVKYFNTPFFASRGILLQSKRPDCLLKYVYCVLKNKQEDIAKFKQGAVIRHLYTKTAGAIKIPLPPLDVQEKLIKEFNQGYDYIDECNDDIKNSRNKIDNKLKDIRNMFESVWK